MRWAIWVFTLKFLCFFHGKVTLFRDKHHSKTSVRPWRMKALKRRCGYMTLPQIHGIEGEGNWQLPKSLICSHWIFCFNFCWEKTWKDKELKSTTGSRITLTPLQVLKLRSSISINNIVLLVWLIPELVPSRFQFFVQASLGDGVGVATWRVPTLDQLSRKSLQDQRRQQIWFQSFSMWVSWKIRFFDAVLPLEVLNTGCRISTQSYPTVPTCFEDGRIKKFTAVIDLLREFFALRLKLQARYMSDWCDNSNSRISLLIEVLRQAQRLPCWQASCYLCRFIKWIALKCILVMRITQF